MSVTAEHPEYTSMQPDWVVMQDTYAGERAVKVKGSTYLDPTPAMLLDGVSTATSPGAIAYDRYKRRAVFWDFVSEAVQRLSGMMHAKPANIKLPAVMEALRARASREGETLQHFLRRINEQQLVYGRLGLLADLPAKVITDPKAVPYIALYDALSLINWDVSHDDEGVDVTQLVVLNETSFERNQEFSWEEIQKYRVLEMSPVVIEVAPSVEGQEPVASLQANTYYSAVYRMVGGNDDKQNMVAPMYKGRTLNKIPFEFVNSKDLLSSPDKPPLLGLAMLCLTIYRGEADYRQSLFMQGQDTLVIIGGAPVDEPALGPDAIGVGQSSTDSTARRVGAGATIEVNLGGDAKYIGVDSAGLPEQRSALENDKLAASTKAGQLVSPKAGKQESGDALTTRISSQVASLMSIAVTGAAGLERILKTIAEWMGANPDEVSVEANTEFVDQLMTFKDLADAMDARQKGAPMSLKSIHDNMVARGMSELSFEEEIKQIVEELTLQGAAPIIPLDPNKKPAPAGPPKA